MHSPNATLYLLYSTFYGVPQCLLWIPQLKGDMEPLGCLGDMGWYCIRFALEMFSATNNGKPPMPKEVRLVRHRGCLADVRRKRCGLMDA